MRSFWIVCISLLLWSCQKETEAPSSPPVTVFSGEAMTIDYKISVGKALDKEAIAQVEHLLASTFQEVHAIYDKYNPDSEISYLNQLPANVEVELSPELEDFLEQVSFLVDISGGRFDPTIEPLQALWKEHLEKGSTPSEEEIAAVLPAVGWHHLSIENGRFAKDHPQTSLDLGGIAKGLCVDMLTERLNQAGYPDVFVEWGGEVRASGEHPEGRNWRVGIRHPPSSQKKETITPIDLQDQSFATSGDYLQYWKIPEGPTAVTYYHIFDPKSHRPLQSKPGKLTSVSVLASTCAWADGIATVAMMFDSEEEAAKWLEKVKGQLPDIAYWCITRNE